MRYPNLRTLDFNLLLVLHSLLETRSTVLTAQRLNMSQPAVSRALQRLRALFNDKLLLKGGRGMIATDHALSLAQPLVDVLRRLEEFLGTPSFTPATSDRRFRIATTDYGAFALLPRLLSKVAAEAPNVRIEVDTLSRDVFDELASGALDLIFIGELPLPAHLRFQHLFTDEYEAAVRSDHPAAALILDGEMSLDAYLSHQHIRVQILNDHTGADVSLGRVGLERGIATELPYFAVAAIVASTTDAILTIPKRAMRHLARQYNLITFLPPEEIVGFGYKAVWHERTDADFGAIWLRRKVMEAAEPDSV